MLDSKNVTLLEREGRKYYIVGTAHVSSESVDEVHQVIEDVKPDTVCVELCDTRYTALNDQDRWKNLDIFKVIKEGKTLMLLANLAVGAYQRRLGEELGVEPGAELIAGAKKAEEMGAELCLVDRDIQITLKRTWANLSFWQKLKLMNAIFASLIFTEEIEKEDIEQLKEKDQLSDMMDEFAKAMPEVKEPLIDERDQYLMSKIEEAPGDTIVAIVGAGHVAGMQRFFGKPVDREKITQIPPPSSWVRSLKWVVPILLVAAFGWGIQKEGGRSVEELIFAWLIPNSVMAGLFCTLAGGKFLSIITAIIGSPITSLNPLLGAGMATGLVEAWLRKPTVADCERINSDVKSLSGLYKNPFTRVLLVAVASNVGSALGAYAGLFWVAKLVA